MRIPPFDLERFQSVHEHQVEILSLIHL